MDSTPQSLARGAGAPPPTRLPGTWRATAAPPAAPPEAPSAVGSRRITVRPGPVFDAELGASTSGPGADAHSASGIAGAGLDPSVGTPPRRLGLRSVRRAAADGSPSFDDFYAATRLSVGRALVLAIGDADLAVDATDEALARAYERWAVVSRLDRPEGWVYRVGLNWSLSVLRRRRRSPHRFYEPPTVDGPQALDGAVHRALGALDVKHRSVVVCRFLLGWSVSDTATALGVREGTVKSRLHRAVKQLEERLGHLRFSEEES